MLHTRGIRICKILKGESHKSLKKLMFSAKKIQNQPKSRAVIFYLFFTFYKVLNAYLILNHTLFLISLKISRSQPSSATNQKYHVKLLYMENEQRLQKIVQQWQVAVFFNKWLKLPRGGFVTNRANLLYFVYKKLYFCRKSASRPI